jgi:Signal transduction histidine kinase
MKMKTIKKKILTPFLVLIIIIPLLTLLVFNAAMRIYTGIRARAELKNTVQTMEALIKKELAENAAADEQSVGKAYLNITTALKASKLASSTEVVYFNRNGQLSYPKNTAGTFLNGKLIGKLSEAMKDAKTNKTYSFNIGFKRYIAVGYKLLKNAPLRSPYIVFVSSLNEVDGLTKIINLMLICIMLLGIVISIFIANIISNHISEPVKKLVDVTDSIGKGEIVFSRQNTDILEISRLEDSISGMAGRLSDYDKAQKAFLQNASHELRTPLMSIQGYAEGIESGVLEDTKKAAGIISSESKRLNSLVEELLTLSRIENQTIKIEVEKINLCDILKEYVQRLEGFALKEQKEISLNLPGSPVYVTADDMLLYQVIMNVASNCIRHGRKAITISLSSAGNTAVISIKDDGNGISETDMPHIFERLYKGKGGNFGLGLAIAKSAIEYMNGSIKAQNTPEGAEFIISLPEC